MKHSKAQGTKRIWMAGLCACCLALSGCAEGSKTIVLAPTPTPQAADVQAESCQYDVSRIDRPQIENGIAAYNWMSWYAAGEHSILCGGYDVNSGAEVIERVDYRYGFHETVRSIAENEIPSKVVDTVIAPDGSRYALLQRTDGQYTLSLYEMDAADTQPKVQATVDADQFGTPLGVEWSGDSTTCLVFFQTVKERQYLEPAPMDVFGRRPSAGGTVQEVLEQTECVYVLVCTMDGAVGQAPLEIPVQTQAPLCLAKGSAFVSMDGRMAMLQGYNAATGEDQSFVFALNQERTAIEKQNVLSGFFAQTAWLGEDTIRVVDSGRLYQISDIWNTADRQRLFPEKAVAQRTDTVIAPNGKAIAFGQMDKNSQWDIYIGVIGQDGTVTEKIAYKGADWVYQLSFSPESTRLLVQTEPSAANEAPLMIIEFK